MGRYALLPSVDCKLHISCADTGVPARADSFGRGLKTPGKDAVPRCSGLVRKIMSGKYI